MAILPARLLTGILAIEFPVEFNNDSTSPAFGAATRWFASITVVAQVLGIPGDRFTFSYDVNDIEVGDWVASSYDGRALKIVEIRDISGDIINVTLEDYQSYNAMNDATMALDGSIPSADCFIFTLNSHGMPVLGPLPVGISLDIAQDNLFARFNQFDEYTYTGGGGGGSEFLQEPTDGSYNDGAIAGWVPGVTKQADAFDQLNFFLNKVLPPRPTVIADYEITFTNQTPVTEGTLLANGLVNSYIPNVVLPYLTEIIAVDDTDVSTDAIVGVGLGNAGSLTFEVNTVLKGSRDLTDADDTGIYSGLRITDDYEYPPNTNGIWKAMDIILADQVQSGINEFTLTHSLTGTATKRFVVENMLDDPIITNTSMTPSDLFWGYSSGVPHLTNDSRFTFGMTGEKLVGRTFPAAKNMGVMTTPDIGSGYVDYSHTDFPPILAVNNGPITVGSVQAILNGTNIATEATLNFVARNSFKTTTQAYPSKILYMDGQGQFLSEDLDDIKRVILPDTARPIIPAIVWADEWDSGGPSNVGSLQLWDAPIVGGKATANTKNYATGYIPVGPNFSSKPTTQYLSYKIQKVTNRLKLEITGTYTGVYVALPGIENDMPNAINGWWDGTKQADHAPLVWPGHSSASDGCLMSSIGDVREFTFGNISSAASTENIILIRFVLTGSDEILNVKIL